MRQLLSIAEQPIKVILYVRKQKDMFESLYYEAIKSGWKSGFDQWLKSAKQQRNLDYIKLLEPWREIFGFENLIVRLYDKRTLKNNDSVADILDVLEINNIELKNLPRIKRLNRSPDYRGLEVLRKLNTGSFTNEIKYKRTISLLEKIPFRRKIRITEQDEKEISQTYRQSNEKFAQTYLTGVSAKCFISN